MQDKAARQLGGGGGGLTEDEGEDEGEPPLKKPAAELVKEIGGQERRVVHGVAKFAATARLNPASIPRASREQEQEPEQMQQVHQQQQQQWSMDSIMEAAMYKLVYGE